MQMTKVAYCGRAELRVSVQHPFLVRRVRPVLRLNDGGGIPKHSADSTTSKYRRRDARRGGRVRFFSVQGARREHYPGRYRDGDAGGEGKELVPELASGEGLGSRERLEMEKAWDRESGPSAP